MNTLVTGGTGFLGRALVARLLAEGHRVSVLSRRSDPSLARDGVRVIAAPLENAAVVASACAGMECVFHVAAKVGVWGREEDFFSTNVLGTRAVLAGCRQHGVARLIYTSTPSVVYQGGDLSGVDESAPLTTDCPSPYPRTKATAEAEVLAANSPTLRTIALRPHLIWGVGDPHLVPRLLDRARSGRLRIVGEGRNRVDLVYISNAVDAQLLAERALVAEPLAADPANPPRRADGRAFFITNGEPVLLWDWINGLLENLGEPPVTKYISLRAATALGAGAEFVWRTFRCPGEPPMTRFVAAELAHDHWFDITAARRDLGYRPRVSMEAGMRELVAAIGAAKTAGQ